jgi:fucose 4-O-acetylase-like acetyltransferase
MRSPADSRDPWLDNAKMALVTLVVIGHAWTLLPSGRLPGHLYDFVYAWHVPAFVLVTGYLSRSFDYSPGRLWQLIRTVAVPYVLFEFLMALFRVHVGGEELGTIFLDPHWPMWYLAALFCWRLLTPVFAPLPGGLALAVVLSLGAGMWAGDALDLARVFGLLPFFVLGLKARQEWLDLLRGPFPRVLAVAVLAGIWFLTGFTDRYLSTEWLYYRSQYVDLGMSDEQAMLARAVVLAVGLAGALAFLALVPRRGGWFARMGAFTLVIYLGHGFVVKAALFAGVPEWAARHPLVALLLVTVGAVAVALLLAAPAAGPRLQALVDPFGHAERRLDEAVELSHAARAGEVSPEWRDTAAPPPREPARA